MLCYTFTTCIFHGMSPQRPSLPLDQSVSFKNTGDRVLPHFQTPKRECLEIFKNRCN